MEAKIIAVLADVSTRLALHAGGVSFVGFNEESGELLVRFQGTCRTCPLAKFTFEKGVAASVQEQIPEVRKVILVN